MHLYVCLFKEGMYLWLHDPMWQFVSEKARREDIEDLYCMRQRNSWREELREPNIQPQLSGKAVL